jgi:two-component system OmpR family sensor kinase
VTLAPGGGRHTAHRWHRSFYWRIGVAFVVFVFAVVVAQSVMFSYRIAQWDGPQPMGSPNRIASSLAADLGTAVAASPDVALEGYLRGRFGPDRQRVYVVTRDGRIAGNTTLALPDDLRRSAEAVLRGSELPPSDPRTRTGGPVVTAPIQVRGELWGLVVLPSPPPGGVMRDVGRLLSLPGTIVLCLATVVAALVIFGPARRRLAALEHAATRLGGGDLSARAPETGGDEIARVAQAFNRMAAELADRDTALRTSDRLRRQMLADVSHELKTPLTAMRGYIETLRMSEAVVDPARRARYFDTAERETRRLERIVNDLVDLARYESGGVPLDERVFDVERVFRHVISRHEQQIAAEDVTVDISVGEGADQMIADPGRIEQVVENLFANALRHTPAGGAVNLAADRENGTVILRVTDSGSGIAPEHLPYVFDRFYKADASRAAGLAGSGLGLSIVKAIVERHGGTIDVSSAPGRTEFRVAIPQ